MKTLVLSYSVENVTNLRLLLNNNKIPVKTTLTPLEWEMSGYCATCIATTYSSQYISFFLRNQKDVFEEDYKIIDTASEGIDLGTMREVVRYHPKVRMIIENLKEIYLNEKDERQWLIASSQGKDSTLLTLLIWVMLEELKPSERFRKVSIITSDTGVEPPDAKKFQKKAIDFINQSAKEKELPIHAYTVMPDIQDSFAVKVIGKGTKPSNSKGSTRGCTYWWKIRPVDQFIESLNTEVIIFLGVRNDESKKREESIRRYNHSYIFQKTDKEGNVIKGQYMCHPIHEVSLSELWDTLGQHDVFPWGIQLDELLEHYQDSAECPMQLGKQNNNSCGNSRNGCTICQMVNDDKMLEAFADKKSWANTAIKFRTLLRNMMFDQKLRKFPSYFRNGSTGKHNPFIGVKQDIKKLKKKERDTLEKAFYETSYPLDGHSFPFYPDNEPGAFNLKARIMLLKTALYYRMHHEELEYVNEEELQAIKIRWKDEFGWEENKEDLTPEEILYEKEALVLNADFTVNCDKGQTTIENLVLPKEYNYKRKSTKHGAKKGDVRILNQTVGAPMRYLFYVHRDISGNERDIYNRLHHSEANTKETIPYFFTNGWRFENGKRIFWNILSFVVCVENVNTFAQACDYVEQFLHKGESKNEKPNWKTYIS